MWIYECGFEGVSSMTLDAHRFIRVWRWIEGVDLSYDTEDRESGDGNTNAQSELKALHCQSLLDTSL